MGVETAAAAGLMAGGSYLGSLSMGRQASKQNKAQTLYYLDLLNTRNQIRDAYKQAQQGWVDYIPEMQQGITRNINFANSIQAPNSSYNNYLNNAAANSLGLGYQKATESIAPQLEGETYNLLENFRNETLPRARSAAIDAGAYGGSRDMLTRERLTKNVENQIVAQAAADIANQRAQTPALLQADANSVSNYLNTGTAANNLLTNAANQQQSADMAKTNYLWQLAMDYGNAMGSSQTTKPASLSEKAYQIQGITSGLGWGMGLGNLLGGSGLLSGLGGGGVTSSGGGIGSGTVNGMYQGSYGWSS